MTQSEKSRKWELSRIDGGLCLFNTDKNYKKEKEMKGEPAEQNRLEIH